MMVSHYLNESKWHFKTVRYAKIKVKFKMLVDNLFINYHHGVKSRFSVKVG